MAKAQTLEEQVSVAVDALEGLGAGADQLVTALLTELDHRRGMHAVAVGFRWVVTIPARHPNSGNAALRAAKACRTADGPRSLAETEGNSAGEWAQADRITMTTGYVEVEAGGWVTRIPLTSVSSVVYQKPITVEPAG